MTLLSCEGFFEVGWVFFRLSLFSRTTLGVSFLQRGPSKAR